MKKYYDIVSAADDAYAPYLGVMLVSLFENAAFDGIARVTVLDGGMSRENHARLRTVANRFGFEMVIQHVVLTEHLTFSYPFLFSPVTYFRLILERYLDTSTCRALYLDADTFVRGDITSLWDRDFGDALVCAVCDPFAADSLALVDKPARKYFNAGVMMLNIERWRAESVTQRIAAHVEHLCDEPQFYDQDILNAVMSDRVEHIDLRYGFLTYLFRYRRYAHVFGLTEFEEARSNPVVVHYASPGRSKPWLYATSAPFVREYRETMQRTPWAEEWRCRYTRDAHAYWNVFLLFGTKSQRRRFLQNHQRFHVAALKVKQFFHHESKRT